MGVAQLAPDARQRVAGVVQHFAALVNATRDLVNQALGNCDAPRHIGHVRELVVQPGQCTVQRFRALQRAAHFDEIHRQERAATQRLLDSRPHVVNAAQMHVALLFEQASPLARFLLPLLGLSQIVGRLQRQGAFDPQREGGVAGQPVANLIEFQDA